MVSRYRLAFVLLCSIFLVGWTSGPTDTFNATNNWSMRQDGQTAFYDFNLATDSGWIDWSSCSEISMYFDPDEDGANTGATIHIRESTENTGTCSAGTIVAVDRNNSGDITTADEVVWTGATGARGFQHVQRAASFGCVDVVAVAATPDDSRVVITCHQ